MIKAKENKGRFYAVYRNMKEKYIYLHDMTQKM